MKSRFVMLLLAGALAASVGLNLVLGRAACRGCALCEQPSPAQIQDCIECLALSPEQCAALMQNCGSCCGEANAVEGRIKAVTGELQRALRTEPMDVVRVRELGRQLVQLRGEAITTGIESALRMRAVLTPEQVGRMDRTLGTKPE